MREIRSNSKKIRKPNYSKLEFLQKACKIKQLLKQRIINVSWENTLTYTATYRRYTTGEYILYASVMCA